MVHLKVNSLGPKNKGHLGGRGQRPERNVCQFGSHSKVVCLAYPEILGHITCWSCFFVCLFFGYLERLLFMTFRFFEYLTFLSLPGLSYSKLK